MIAAPRTIMKIYGISDDNINSNSVLFYELWGINGFIVALWFLALHWGFERTAALVAATSAIFTARFALTKKPKLIRVRETLLFWILTHAVLFAILAANGFQPGRPMSDLAIHGHALVVAIAAGLSVLFPKIVLERAYGPPPYETRTGQLVNPRSPANLAVSSAPLPPRARARSAAVITTSTRPRRDLRVTGPQGSPRRRTWTSGACAPPPFRRRRAGSSPSRSRTPRRARDTL